MNRITNKVLFLIFSTLSILIMIFLLFFSYSAGILNRRVSKPDTSRATLDYDCQTCFFVSKNNPTGCNDNWLGTEAEPWCSIRKAANTLRAGETVLIKKGIYYEQVVPKYAGAPGEYITYKNFGTDEVVIEGVFTVLRDGIRIENKSYLRFAGLELRGWDLAGINVDGSTAHVIIDKLTIKNNNYGIKFKGKPGEAVTDSVIMNSTIQNNWDSGVLIYRTCENIIIDHNLITNNATVGIDKRAHGIEIVVWSDDVYPHDGPKNVIVTNNEISYNRTQGIMTWEVNYILIQNNHIHHNGATGVQIENGTDYAVIENNLIEHNSQQHAFEGGIWIDDAENIVVQGNTLRGNKMGLIIGRSGLTLFRYNLIYHNNAGVKNNRNAMGVNVNYSTQDSILVHNTLYQNGHSDTQRAGISLASYTDKQENRTNKVKSPRVKNNIVSETLADLDLWVGSQAEDYESDYNVFYNIRDLLVRYDSINMIWSQYLTVSSQDANSITTNPLLSDPKHGDFTLEPESPAIDGGGDLTTTTSSGNGKAIVVADARYFADGFSLIEGDLIQVGSNYPVRIILVDYATNTITVNTNISWNEGDGVSYPYLGLAPDIGANESTPIMNKAP